MRRAVALVRYHLAWWRWFFQSPTWVRARRAGLDRRGLEIQRARWFAREPRRPS